MLISRVLSSQPLAKLVYGDLKRSKVSYLVGAAGGLIVFISFFSSKLSYNSSLKVSYDFFIALLSNAFPVLGIVFGSVFVKNDIENGFFKLVKSMPVSSWDYACSKTYAFVGFCVVNFFFLYTVHSGIHYAYGGWHFELLALQYLYILLETIIVFHVAMFLSIFWNSITSAILTGAFWLTGHLMEIAMGEEYLISPSGFTLKEVSLRAIFPRFYMSDISNWILYADQSSALYLLIHTAYLAMWMFVSFFIFYFVLSRKDHY